jgi:hypothetical protein
MDYNQVPVFGKTNPNDGPGGKRSAKSIGSQRATAGARARILDLLQLTWTFWQNEPKLTHPGGKGQLKSKS